MESPFPGMDPYLEEPKIWPDVHHQLISSICNQLQPKLAPNYRALITPYVAFESIEIAPVRRVCRMLRSSSAMRPHHRIRGQRRYSQMRR